MSRGELWSFGVLLATLILTAINVFVILVWQRRRRGVGTEEISLPPLHAQMMVTTAENEVALLIESKQATVRFIIHSADDLERILLEIGAAGIGVWPELARRERWGLRSEPTGNGQEKTPG